MPHHMEYFTPPAGERIFANAHHHEMSLLIDVSNPLAPTIAKTFGPPAPLRFPHDFTRTPTGTRLVGFLRSEGASPDPQEVVSPGNHGGIAEYTADGELLRRLCRGTWSHHTDPPVRVRVFAAYRPARRHERCDDGAS
jgi:hypothetical protein